MHRILSHAWGRSFQTFGGTGAALALLAVPVVGFVLHYAVSGTSAMQAEVHTWAIYGLAASGVVFSAIFFWNFACAPYRIERDKRLELETRLNSLTGIVGVPLEDIVRTRDAFPLWQAACLLADVPAHRSISGTAAHYLHEIKRDVFARQLASIDRDAAENQRGWMSALARLTPAHQQVDAVKDSEEIDREHLAELANRLNRKITGLNA